MDNTIPILPQGCVVGRILHSTGEGPDVGVLADTAVNVGVVEFVPATAYRKLAADTVVTHSKLTAKLDSHGHLHPQRVVSDNTGTDAEDAIWLPVGTWSVTYRLNNGTLPTHNIVVTEAHTALAPLALFASMDGAPEAGATYVTLQVPLNGTPGYYLVMGESGIGLSWAQGVPPETIAAAVEDYLVENPPAGSGAYPVQQVTLTGDLAYTLPAGAPADQVISVVFTQNATGGHTVTYGGAPVTVDTTAGASTLVEFWPGGTLTYPGVSAPAGASSAITADDTPAAPAEGESASYFVTSAVSWPAGLVWSTDPDGGVAPTITGTALVSLFTVGGTTRAILGATFPALPDTVAPVAGTLASSSITETGFTLTVTGASDAGGLHAQPYSFDTGAGTFGAWQTAATLAVTGKAAGTAYTARHKVRDAAGNETPGTSIIVTTVAADTTAPVWTATLTPGTPTETSVVVAASALATDNVGVTGYEVSYDNGSTWAAIVPSGLNFTLAGTAGTTYATSKLRAKDAAGNTSTPVLSVPSYTMAASSDSTAPTVGTMAASAITATGFTLTVSSASDETALHATPYAFTTDGGTNWTAYQASPVYVATGKTAETGYSCNWRVRDAAGNVSTGTARTVTTAVAATYFTDFSEYAAGAAPSGWSSVWDAPAVFSVVEDATATGGKGLRLQNTVAGRTAAVWSAIPYDASTELVARFKLASTPPTPTVTVGMHPLRARVSGNGTAETGLSANYLISPAFAVSASSVMYAAGTPTESAYSNPLGFNAAAGVWYWIRAAFVANTVSVRIWADGNAEPSTWQSQHTFTSPPTSGGAGLGGFTVADVIFDVFGAGIGGAAAPVSA